MGSEPKAGNLVCSFCGKRQDEVRKLIAGPTVYICDECVALCMQVLGYQGRLPKLPKPKADAMPEKKEANRLRILCLSVTTLLSPTEEVNLRNDMVNQGRLSPEESSELATAIGIIRRLTPKISN